MILTVFGAADEVIKEVGVGNNIEIIIPEEMWETESGKKAIKEADKIMKSIEDFQKSSERRKFLKSMTKGFIP